MKIKDLNGNILTIEDLDEAIEQADLMKELGHIPPIPLDDEMKKYWSDLYEKLITLKKEKNEQSSR